LNHIVLIDQVKCATDIIVNLQKQFQRNDGAKGYLKGVQERVGREEEMPRREFRIRQKNLLAQGTTSS